MIDIWNEVVEDGIAFPQEDLLNNESGKEFLAIICAIGYVITGFIGSPWIAIIIESVLMVGAILVLSRSGDKLFERKKGGNGLMEIKAVKFRKDGFYSQPFALGGEDGPDKYDKNIRYRGRLQNYLIDTEDGECV
ncbi:MAG: hypothetical protein K6E91_12360 [Butyrivibrio sp.]|nr:hypothetical protein [Butyrivibrio sp.]